MIFPNCLKRKNSCIDTRNDGDKIHRRRQCELCGTRWSTIEMINKIRIDGIYVNRIPDGGYDNEYAK